jgi:hypothetical protein
MGVVELTLSEQTYLKRRAQRLKRSEHEKGHQRAAWVEAAVVESVQQAEDPEFVEALKLVALSVKHLLSPRALAYLESTLESDERAGMIRWRELTRLELWLRRCAIPRGNARSLVGRGYNRQNDGRREYAKEHPFKLLELRSPMVPGRTLAAVYGIAKRAKVRPNTVVAALLNFGLERVAQALRETKEVPPSLSHEMLAAFPIAENP